MASIVMVTRTWLAVSLMLVATLAAGRLEAQTARPTPAIKRIKPASPAPVQLEQPGQAPEIEELQPPNLPVPPPVTAVPPPPLTLPAAPAPWKITVTGPKEALVDQPFTVKLHAVNVSAKTAGKTEFVIVERYGHGTTSSVNDTKWAIPSLSPKASHTIEVQVTPRRAGNLQVSLINGFFDNNLAPVLPPIPGGGPVMVFNESAFTDVVVKFSPKTPVQDFLPAAPKTAANGKFRLPQELSQVPEVSLHDPLSKTMTHGDALMQIARTVDKINYVNKKKTDAFMEELLSRRTDLAGLQFAMGDSCRLRKSAAGNSAWPW